MFEDDGAKISLWFPKFLLKVVCMWPGKDNVVIQRLAFWLLMSFCLFIEYGLYCFIAENFQDFNESFAAISSFSTTLQVIVKISVLYYYLNSAKGIMDIILHKFWPSNLISKELEESLKSDYHGLLIGMMSIYATGLSFSISFLLTPLIKRKRETPYSIVYPFDYNDSPKFELMYFVQCFINFYIVLHTVCAVDSLFMAICYNISVQYRLLQKAILKLGTDEMKNLNSKLISLDDEFFSKEENVTEERQFLIRCINHHCLLLRTIQEVEKVFSLIGFFQLGFSVVAICLSSFLLTREDVEFSQLTKVGIFMLGHIVQLFCYCSVANEIDVQMNNLSQYVFSSFWYQTDIVRLKTEIIFVIKKSQEVRKLTALKLFPLNYETFIQVLRISFSFHTLLSTIAEK